MIDNVGCFDKDTQAGFPAPEARGEFAAHATPEHH
jgi:hypothetical protein